VDEIDGINFGNICVSGLPFGPFLKLFARNKIFWPSFNVEENSTFSVLFWKNLSKTYNIL